jgi:hypothetical protein
LLLTSEFAKVKLDLDTSGNGTRLRIEDLKTGHIGYLDPLELESLAWATKGELAPLLDPGASRWKAISAAAVDEIANPEGGGGRPESSSAIKHRVPVEEHRP